MYVYIYTYNSPTWPVSILIGQKPLRRFCKALARTVTTKFLKGLLFSRKYTTSSKGTCGIIWTWPNAKVNTTLAKDPKLWTDPSWCFFKNRELPLTQPNHSVNCSTAQVGFWGYDQGNFKTKSRHAMGNTLSLLDLFYLFIFLQQISICWQEWVLPKKW